MLDLQESEGPSVCFDRGCLRWAPGAGASRGPHALPADPEPVTCPLSGGSGVRSAVGHPALGVATTRPATERHKAWHPLSQRCVGAQTEGV